MGKTQKAPIAKVKCITPVRDDILIQRDSTELVTNAGIIKSAYDDEQQPREASVLKCGPDCEIVKPGDRILTAVYCGTDYIEDGVAVQLIKSQHVQAIIND